MESVVHVDGSGEGQVAYGSQAELSSKKRPVIPEIATGWWEVENTEGGLWRLREGRQRVCIMESGLTVQRTKRR